MTFKCELCRKPYKAGELHECSIDDLKDRALTANKGADAFVAMFIEKFAWCFSLDGNVTVKVAFHLPDSVKLSKQHVQAFARIFAAAAENYIPEHPEEEAAHA